jgi:hypothetical protein
MSSTFDRQRVAASGGVEDIPAPPPGLGQMTPRSTQPDPALPAAAGTPPGAPGSLGLPPPREATGMTKVDAKVHAAWVDHQVTGFAQNKLMFQKVLSAFMWPYWITVVMYGLLFVVGIAGFVFAVILGYLKGLEFALAFGGLSVVAFLTFFIRQPLTALEDNLQFITWLGIIYNTYWTRLMYANDGATVQKDLVDITNTTLQEMDQLVDKHAAMASKRPGLLQAKDTTPAVAKEPGTKHPGGEGGPA